MERPRGRFNGQVGAPMDMEDLSGRLRALGLDESHARVYLQLLETGPAKARVIHEELEISRPTVYRLLDDLCDAGVASKGLSRPTVYEGTAPDHLFDRRRGELQDQLAHLDRVEDEVLGSLEDLRGQPDGGTEHHWNRIEGDDQIYETLGTVLRRTEESIWTASNHPPWFRRDVPGIEQAWDTIGARARAGTQARVLAGLSGKAAQAFEAGLPEGPIACRWFSAEPTVHFIVLDGSEVFSWVRTGPGDLGAGEEPVALWTNAPRIVDNQRLFFDRLWSTADETPPADAG